MKGVWEGASRFEYSQAAYRFHFFSFSATQSAFVSVVADVEAQIAAVGRIASVNTLAYNLLLWMTWEYNFVNNGHVQKVTFSGDFALYALLISRYLMIMLSCY